MGSRQRAHTPEHATESGRNAQGHGHGAPASGMSISLLPCLSVSSVDGENHLPGCYRQHL